mgnify:CR=1 FL=1
MRKADLVNIIAEIKASLSKNENVYIRGFGSFITKRRAKKVGRHIKNNVSIEIPAHYIPSFKPAKVFVDEVKDGVPPEE